MPIVNENTNRFIYYEIEILGDDYLGNEKSIELKTKTMNGVTYTSSGVLNGETNVIDGGLSCKYKVSGASMTSKLTTAGQLTHESVLDNTGVKGLKLTILGGVGCTQIVTATGEYVHPHVSSIIKADFLNKPSITSSLTLGLNGVNIGGQGKYDVDSKEIRNINGILNYSNNEHEASIQILDKGKSSSVSYSHIISNDFSVAAEFMYGAGSNGGSEDTTTTTKLLTMGTKYDVDDETCIKAKFNSAGSMWLCYVQEIRKNTKLTLSTMFDVRKMEKPSHTFGLALAIE